MKLLVTGASGFLGRHVVAEALRRGHHVTAMVRPRSDVNALSALRGELEIARHDLRDRRGLTPRCEGVDAVLHLAAVKSGDLAQQLQGNLVATENLLLSMREARVSRIVAISSLAVYDYRRRRSFTVLDESAEVEALPAHRDPYAQTKLAQERLIREYAEENRWEWTVLRPGVVYGRENLWTARLGVKLGRLWLRVGGWARVPLTYVENCAEAILLSVESRSAVGQTLNVIDDSPPTQRGYVAELRRRLSPKPRIVPVPFLCMTFLAAVASLSGRMFYGRHANVPNILTRASLHARCKPLRFSNEKIKATLGWRMRYSLSEGLNRSLP